MENFIVSSLKTHRKKLVNKNLYERIIKYDRQYTLVPKQ